MYYKDLELRSQLRESRNRMFEIDFLNLKYK